MKRNIRRLLALVHCLGLTLSMFGPASAAEGEIYLRPIAGGVVLRQGDIEVNCTLDSLLELSRGSLDAEVARILFQ